MMSVTNTPTFRTPEEIADLKSQWQNDPCWDIENTEGFEAHREELAAYREAIDAFYDAQFHAVAEARRAEQRKIWGENAPDAALNHIHSLEQKLDWIEQKVHKIEDRLSMIRPSALYES